ncbi:MAG: NUDIX domain-containing protein [Bacteroidota bacterium]
MSHKSEDIISPLSIDCVLFGFEQAELKVLLIRRAIDPKFDHWALPGGFILYAESVENASKRILAEMTGVQDLFLEQLKAFGRVDRYPGKRVVTIAYYALIKPGNYQLNPGSDASEAAWFPISKIQNLPFDHKEILNTALDTLRRKVRHQPIGFELLPGKFTLLQLQELYEAIFDIKLDKPNFRRKFKRMNLLVELDERQKDVAHRAARLYRFDKERYDRLYEGGFVFEV